MKKIFKIKGGEKTAFLLEVLMIRKFIEHQIGTINDEEWKFAKQGMKDERTMKGLVFKQKGERLDLIANYIMFYREYLKK